MSDAVHKDLAPERQAHLREIIREREAVRVDELCAEIGVSPATVRRDLEILESEGKIKRVHGGAVNVGQLLEEPLFDDKTEIASEEKKAIAREASKLILETDTVYLDGGSTVLELAKLLRNRTKLTVVTNSLRAASELSHGGPRLILIGGELRRRSQTIIGTLSRGTLDRIHLDKAFMGTMGITIDKGLTTTDPNEAFTKELVMSRSEQVILLADSVKVGQVSFARAGAIKDIDMFVTDSRLDDSFERRLEKEGVRVVKATIEK
ncbi:DeoR/GlpR transcriptional regulator [PVC group bacterium]|nr:DeoR/GlpR transcriptional regulator [PVC group bacterium]